MNTKELFFRARERCPMEQSEFLGYLGDCVRTLLARYPTALLARAGDGEIGAPETLEDDCGLDPLYDGALIAGAIAGKTKEAADTSAFLTEAEHAYRACWRRAAKGKRMARGRW
ncbi:MAG: hypothetical protein IJY20_01720 [Clostridia bacterium]|nr:hypothetical protein [Clostridia bacterium]